MSSKTDIFCDVTGFGVKRLVSDAPKNDEDPGRLTITLVGNKAEIRVNESLGEVNLNDVIAALNQSQEATSTIDLKLCFSLPTELVTRIQAARKSKT